MQGSLQEMITNFESDRRASFYAELYDKCCLPGGHAILLDQRPETRSASTRSWLQQDGDHYQCIMSACCFKVLFKLKTAGHVYM